ncbi:MAG: hypothetical protein ALECFALPRED_009631 [Alectoria fallacina]|uniref:Uncharacterized protein n=1 Tax=Alectoria fallacina TaxID=1903189 RepID=A0A8H3J7N9_9LECA|nr:MAG: hypothetical protein ALECFALPRED_009631 [Alectoria fallacina]
MHDLTTILLAYGGLLVGYGSPLVTYLILRSKAQKAAAGRPIIQMPWWKVFCCFLPTGLFIAGGLWAVAIALSYPDLVSSFDELCPSLIMQDQCGRAALNWQAACVGLGEGAVAAFVFIVGATHTEVKRTATTPERFYPLVILTCSHCLLVVSWLLCTPLATPLKIFNLVGSKNWTSVSSAFAFFAMTAYIFGTALLDHCIGQAFLRMAVYVDEQNPRCSTLAWRGGERLRTAECLALSTFTPA